MGIPTLDVFTHCKSNFMTANSTEVAMNKNWKDYKICIVIWKFPILAKTRIYWLKTLPFFTFERNMSPNILLSYFCFAVLCISAEAKFVNRISDTEYEIKLNESGAFFSQKVTLDKQNSLIITEVPAHHDRVAITNIFDSSIVSANCKEFSYILIYQGMR